MINVRFSQNRTIFFRGLMDWWIGGLVDWWIDGLMD
jgi:hypothetical protein